MNFIKFSPKHIRLICNAMGLMCFFLLAFHTHASQHDIYKIGVMVGHTSKNSSKSNTEKICILKSTTDTLTNTSRDISVIFVENNRSASGSAQAALELIDKDVDIAVLPLLSKEAEAAAAFLTEAKIPYITSATAMEVIKDTSLGLSIMPSNLYQAEVLASYYLAQNSMNTLHIVNAQANRYSTEVSKEFLRLVLTQNPEIDVQVHQFTFESQKEIAQKIESGDVIFAPLFNPHIASFYHELAATDKERLTILGPDSIGGRKEFYDIIEQVSPNISVKFLKNWDGEVKGPNEKLFNSYANTYCPFEYTSFLSAYSFDLIQLIESQIDQLSTLQDKKQAISVLKSSKYKTAMDGKSIDISNTGHNKKPMYLYQVTSQGNQKVTTLYVNESSNDK
ncbi:ABC transporter substrate-binding protein [Vibrio tubiashii]|uniref:ABC transporter substrate-binding protein n=1 Tax=Vibrio tubiashii TaxID=29498 RepID=UPI003CE587D7